MTTRRDFLRGLVTLGGVAVVGPAALEALDRLTHRKVWTGWDVPLSGHHSSLAVGYRRVTTNLYKAFATATGEYSWFDDVPQETYSPREMLIPLDLSGRATIPRNYARRRA